MTSSSSFEEENTSFSGLDTLKSCSRMWRNYKESLKRDKAIRMGDKLFNYSEIAQRQKNLELLISSEKQKIMEVLSLLTEHRGHSSSNTSKTQSASVSFSGSNNQLLSSTMSLGFDDSLAQKGENQLETKSGRLLLKELQDESQSVKISKKLFGKILEIFESYSERVNTFEQMLEEIAMKLPQLEESILCLEDDLNEATSHIDKLSSSLIKMHKSCEVLVFEKKELILEVQALKKALETEQKTGELREETIRQKMNYSVAKCSDLEVELKKTKRKLGLAYQSLSQVAPMIAMEMDRYN